MTVGVDQLFASQGKNKFQGGKEAKKAAAALKAEREAVAQLMEDPEERKRTEALLAEYREKRGPSLMDAHLEKMSKKPKKVDTRLKSFDHEKVVQILVQLMQDGTHVDSISIKCYLFMCPILYVNCRRWGDIGK